MSNHNNDSKRRFNRPGEIVRVDIHQHNGMLIDRMKAHTTEKEKGAMIIDRLKDRFGVTDADINNSRRIEVFEKKEEITPSSITGKKIVWKRDVRGNII